MGVMLMCSHEFDVALCDFTVKNVVLSLSLIGHPCSNSNDGTHNVITENIIHGLAWIDVSIGRSGIGMTYSFLEYI